jgi:hypothetical protein
VITTPTTDSPTCAALLAATAGLLAAAGEPPGASLFALLASAAKQHAAQLEAEATEAAAAEALRVGRALAEVAAGLNGAAVILDGGPSDYGVSDWLASFAGAAG